MKNKNAYDVVMSGIQEAHNYLRNAHIVTILIGISRNGSNLARKGKMLNDIRIFATGVVDSYDSIYHGSWFHIVHGVGWFYSRYLATSTLTQTANNNAT